MRNTKQRNEVYDAVLNSCDHPNAETIYTRVKANMSGISLGTVYRNLCLLVKQGLVRQIPAISGGYRYDKTLKNHCHFFCHCCGGVCDIDYDFSAADSICQSLSGDLNHKIDGMTVMFSGICKSCRDKNGCKDCPDSQNCQSTDAAKQEENV